jgi:hypothetical protein
MNFDDMPELHWPLGYAYVYLLFMAVVLLAVLLMWYNGLIKVGEGGGLGGWGWGAQGAVNGRCPLLACMFGCWEVFWSCVMLVFRSVGAYCGSA